MQKYSLLENQMKSPRSIVAYSILLILAITIVAVHPVLANEKDVAFLLEGVDEIAAPGVPGPLCVFGEKAFAVVAAGPDTARQPVVAAGPMGAGRVVAFGHTGYLGSGKLYETGQTGRLIINAVHWAAGQHDRAAGSPKIGVYGQPGTLDYLKAQKLNAVALAGPQWLDKLRFCDVLCIKPSSISNPRQIARIEQFVTDGGGLIVADLGWGWLQLNRGKNLVDHHPGNLLLRSAGIAWADGTLNRTCKIGYTAGDAPPALTNAAWAVDALVAHSEGRDKLGDTDVRQAVWVACQAARILPDDDKLLMPRLATLEQKHSESAIPRPKLPLTMRQPLGRLLLTLRMEQIANLAPEEITAHPAAEAFPGSVADDVPRVTRVVRIDTSVPNWHSTGLYAAPGELITVELPVSAAKAGLGVRIGAHHDRLWGKDTWRRCPDVCRRFPLDAPRTLAANAFGGLVYIDVPKNAALGTVSVKISGAVEAPYYELGTTTADQWRSSIRLRPAPWSELATDKVVLTLPSEAVRDLDDPEELMRFWNRVLDCCAELATIPKNRLRPERYVADTQISAGYMHAGYPIMVQMDIPRVMVDKARLTAQAHGGVWGLFHEVGHNHQSGDWTFGGTGEVTVNLFTLYVLEKVCGIPIRESRKVLGEGRSARVAKYRAAGANFDEWKGDPFLALIMYVELQEAFGWDAFKRVFAEYRDLARNKRPRTDDEKRDQWLVRFSRSVDHNLGPFFQSWGVPTSEAARASVADLPEWAGPETEK